MWGWAFKSASASIQTKKVNCALPEVITYAQQLLKRNNPSPLIHPPIAIVTESFTWRGIEYAHTGWALPPSLMLVRSTHHHHHPHHNSLIKTVKSWEV
jgi:hypothetical protein